MRKLLAFTLFSVFTITLPAQFFIKGLVMSAIDYTVIPNVTISLEKDDGTQLKKVYSDSKGFFIVQNIPAGNYKLSAYEAGFKVSVVQLNITKSKPDVIFELTPLQVVSDEVVVESIKNKKPLGATHTNINAEEIKALNIAQDLPAILNTTPGAVSTSDAGTGVGYTGVRIRGVDATRINVTINGVPFNDAESHGVYWVDLPDLAGNINSIQVQRGIGSSTNGGAAFGSSINIQTTKSSVDPYAIYTSAYGSFQTFKNNIKFGTGLLKNHWTIEGSLSMIKSNGYIDRASSNLKSGYGTISRYGNKSLLKFIVMKGSEVTYQSWYGLPQDSLFSNRTYNAYTYKNQTDNYTQTHFQLLYSYAVNSKLNLNAVLHYTKGMGYYESYYASQKLSDFGMPDFKLNDSSYKSTSDIIDRKWLNNDFTGAVASVVYKEKKYELNAGFSYNEYVGLHYNEVVWADVWTAPKPNGSMEPYQYYYDKGIKKDGNAYAKLFYYFSKKITAFVDLQQRMLSYNFNNALAENITQKYSFFNPKAGLNFMFSDSSNFLMYYGRSAHEPTRDEFVGSTPASLPKAEYLDDIELGYQRKLLNWNITANYYYMNYTNQLVLTGRLNDVGSPVRENVKSSYRTGLELIARRNFNNGFSVNANVSYSKNLINNYTEYVYNYTYDTATAFNYKSTPISFSPDLVFGSSIKYAENNGFEVELISKYVSKQFMDNSGSTDRMLNAYFVNDLFFRYHFRRQKFVDDLRLTLGIYNILSELYESNGATYANMYNGTRMSDNYYYPQAPMHFVVMAQIKF